jgi:hypothetical protein
MKRFIIIIAIILISAQVWAAMYQSTPEKQVVSVGTSGQITTLTGSGTMTIYAPTQIYYELSAVTPSATTSPGLAAGGTANTEQRYFKGDRVGFIASTTTSNVILLFQEP